MTARKWYSLLYCPGRRSHREDLRYRPMHDGATREVDQKEYYDTLEFDRKPARSVLEHLQSESRCPGCGCPYAWVHDAELSKG